MSRDFGATNHNHGPVGNYQQSDEAPGSFGVAVIDNPWGEYGAEFAGSVQPLGNPELPISAYRTEILAAIHDSPVTIIVGETGSGKSTQVPQMLIESGYDVSLTQPRRLAAYMVSERIQEELNGALGDRAAGLVGYQTAEKSTVTSGTKIAVITDGIEVIKQLYDQPSDGRSVHILDEVHEWNTNIELSVALIKQRLVRDPNAKFVLTSATMDAPRLAAYFAEVTGTVPPIVEVPGRTHPIERAEKPDSKVLDEILASTVENPDEDILVFVPGKQEISDTIDELHRRLPESIRRNATILPLHARLKKEDQDRINQPSPGIKIIVSTNVAQTSLTIDGIGVVIDSGLERRVELDDEGVEGLKLFPVSRADCDQRAGRTGRVGPGKYVLTRYDDKIEHVPYANRVHYPAAEITRSDTDRVTLRAAAVDMDLAELDLFHPVNPAAIERSKRALYNLGALDEHGVITPLGRRMNEFPVRATSARMLMEALPMSASVRAQLAAIVAAVEVGGLQYFAPDVGKAWQQLTDETSSDLLAQLDMFVAVQGMTDQELESYNLDVQNVHRAQELYRKITRRTQVGDGDLTPPTSDEREAIKRAVYAGLIDSVYELAGDGKYRRVSSSSDDTLRELSNRSITRGSPRWVVASPYNVEFYRGGMPETRHILEKVTAIGDPRILGEVAASHLLSWELTGQVWRAGVLKGVQRLVLNDCVDLGVTREATASATAETRAFVRDQLLKVPGSAQQRLRDIKTELEELQRLTRQHVPQLTQDMLLGLLDEAVAGVGGDLDLSRIDDTLRQIMAARQVGLDLFMSAERRQDIRANAPDQIVVDSELSFPLSYHRGVPVVTRFTPADIERCQDTLYLSDGREVRFWDGRRRLTLGQIRHNVALQQV